jgi:heme A synthase
VLFDLPIALVTAHHAVAALLLLSALSLYYRVRESRTYGQALHAAVSP